MATLEPDDNTRGDRMLDAAVIIGLLFILASAIYILAFVNIPEKNETLFAALLGTVVGGGVMAYINNRWGSSKGSAEKDKTIAAIAKDGSQ